MSYSRACDTPMMILSAADGLVGVSKCSRQHARHSGQPDPQATTQSRRNVLPAHGGWRGRARVRCRSLSPGNNARTPCARVDSNTTDHTVHKALNPIRGVSMGPRASRSSVLRDCWTHRTGWSGGCSQSVLKEQGGSPRRPARDDRRRRRWAARSDWSRE